MYEHAVAAPAVTVRPAEHGDLDTIVALNQLLAREIDGKALPTAAVRAGVLAQLNDGRLGRYWLASIGPEVVAQLRVWEEWYDWGGTAAWWLDNVCTLPGHRGQGALRALFRHVHALALQAGASRIRLHVCADNAAARQAYAALGFEVIGHAMELALPTRHRL